MKLLRCFGQYLLIGILLVSMGGHLALLQAVAWGNMLVDYSNTDSFTHAVEKTFSGKHPCCLCKLVEKSKEESENKPLLKAKLKWDVALPTPFKLPSPRSTDVEFRITTYTETDLQVNLAVPIRPPRIV